MNPTSVKSNILEDNRLNEVSVIQQVADTDVKARIEKCLHFTDTDHLAHGIHLRNKQSTIPK